VSEQSNKSPTAFDKQSAIIFSLFIAYICYWLRGYFTSAPIPSVDLPAHIALIERLRGQLLFGNVFFYDRFWFTGWPAYEFYAPLAHIFTALVSFALTPISDEPVRLSVHCLLVLGTAAIPIGLHYCSWAYLVELISANKANSILEQRRFTISAQGLLAIICCTLSFWFLNINVDQSIGIGIAGPFSVGLYTQLFGWLCLLFFLGAFSRLLTTPSTHHEMLVVLSFGILFLTHTMTAVYAFGFAVFCWCWFYAHRIAILRSLTISLLLCAFWLVPFLANSGEMRLQYTMESDADFFNLFIRYPLINLVDTFSSLFSGGKSALDVTSLVIPLLLPISFLHRRVRQSKIILPVLVSIIFIQMLSSSEFAIRSLPIEIHFYRLASYSLLALLSILAIIPFVFNLFTKNRRQSAFITALVFITMLCSVSIFPSQAYKDRISDLAKTDAYLSHNQVIDYFKAEKNVGRVLFENSQDRITPGTTHFLPSVFSAKTNLETVNGLFIQSSLAFTIISTYAKLLELPIFSYPIQFPHDDDPYSELNYQTVIDGLKNFGVTHVVAMTENFKTELVKNASLDLVNPKSVDFGAFSIFELKNEFKPVETVNKRVVGFWDLKGNIPFKLIEFYFHANVILSSNFELLKIDDNNIHDLPAELDTIIVNTSDDLVKVKSKLNFNNNDSNVSIVTTNFTPINKFSHYDVSDRSKRDQQHFLELSLYLVDQVKLEQLLKIAYGPKNISDVQKSPTLAWAKSGQEFTLMNLEANKLLRINYSYYPYWKADSGTIYRGSGERIFFKPKKTRALFIFSKNSTFCAKFGYFITILGLFAFLKTYSVQSRVKQKKL
jgi:hypothetical protein